MTILGLLAILWFMISCFCVDSYFDNIGGIKKAYKIAIFTILCGPVVWIVMMGIGIVTLFLQFMKWLKT